MMMAGKVSNQDTDVKETGFLVKPPDTRGIFFGRDSRSKDPKGVEGSQDDQGVPTVSVSPTPHTKTP